MNYKDTLFIPKTTFDMKANLNIKEPKIQAEWIENKIYQKLLEKNKNKPLFFLHDGPPYANGNIHVGHALNKTLKDIIVRYKNFSGFLSPFVPGWDTHGLPIELAMLKKDKNAKEMSVVDFRNKCKEYALEQISIQTEQFKRIGLLTDFQKTYYTLSHDFEIQQLKLFLEMVKQNLIIRDLKPVFWSWSSQSALAEAEIEYAEVESDSVLISFLAEENSFLPKNTYFVIWTTTPWTIPCNLAIAIKPNAKYVVIKYQDKNFVVAEELLENFANKINAKMEDFQIISKHNGVELENSKYYHPLSNKLFPIILADYVSLDDGTGLVHNAPGLGSDDYLACKKYNISPYAPIDKFGKYTSDVEIDELNGVFYLDANNYVIEQLKNKNLLLFHQKIKHSDAHDWRTKKPIIRRATSQWFVNLKPIQQKIIDSLNNDVKSKNPKAINRMIDMISKRVEWCISRQRTWGVPIPMIFDENEQPIYDVELIENIINILDKNGTNVWFEWPVEKFLTPKYQNSKNYYKEKDIMDVWFDSGSTHMMFKLWGFNYPADLYLEGSDQYRGWFNSSLITGVIYNNIAPYKELLQHGFTLDQNGFKMSKSIGNVINPLDVFNKYGADIFRLFVASCEYWDDQRFGDVILNQVSEIYRRIRNTIFKYSLSMLENFEPSNDLCNELEIEDKYVLTKLHHLLVNINNWYNEYNFSNIVKAINEFTLEISSWYFDIIKDSMYCDNLENIRRKQIQTVIYYILKNILIALAPIIPHTAEEVYSYTNFKKFDSIHLEDWIQLTPFVENINMEEFDKFFRFKNEVYRKIEEARENKTIKKSNEAMVFVNNNPTHFTLDQLKKWLNVADVIIDNDISDIQIKQTEFKKCERCWNYYNDSSMHDDKICNRCYKVINK